MVLLLAVLRVRSWLESYLDAADCEGIGMWSTTFSFSFRHCSSLDDNSMMAFDTNTDPAVRVEQVALLRMPGEPPDPTAKACDNHHVFYAFN